MQDVRLYISVASNRDWKGKFGSSLAGLVSHLSVNRIQVEGYNLTNFFFRALGQASSLPKTRQAFVDEIKKDGYTHWLSLDDDMTFPADIVDRLISHDKEVVAVNARRKSEDVSGSLTGLDGNGLISTGKTGLEEIKLMGGAIFLAATQTFHNIPKPHFQMVWSPAHDDYVSEDIYFAALLRTNDVKLYCDHDTSQMVGHIGDYEYKWPKVKQNISLVERAA